MRASLAAFLLIGGCSSYAAEEETALPDRNPAGEDAGDAGGGGDAEAPGPKECEPTPCTLPSPIAPFGLALFGDRTAECPEGWETRDVVESPVANAGSCACGACTATGATCTTGTIGTRLSTNNSCSMNGVSIDANNGQCKAQSGAFSEYALVLPPAGVPGTCSAAGVGVKTAVTAQSKRVCTLLPDACAGGACAIAATLQPCAAMTGDVQCPAALPRKHLVGKDFSLTCSSCTCTATATCSGSVSFYPQANCAGTPVVVPTNACTNVDNAPLESYRWTGTVASQQCASTTPPAKADVALVDTTTICCP